MAIKKETGKERTFDTGAKKQHATGKGTPVLIPGDAILDIAKHFEDGATHYGPRNWEKGIPLSELLNSAERHLQQIKMGMTDESHDRAFVWNAIVYLATKLRIEAGILPKELDDMPRYKKIGTEQHTFTYMCDDCQHEFDRPIIGEFKQGTDMLLNGCPECGCSSYSIIRDIQYPDLCDECTERMKNAPQWEAVELCRECSGRKV